MYVRTLYVRTDVHDVMAIKPNFLTSMGYHIFLSMVLRARAPSARAELRYNTRGYFAGCVVFFRASQGRGKIRAMSKMSDSPVSGLPLIPP